MIVTDNDRKVINQTGFKISKENPPTQHVCDLLTKYLTLTLQKYDLLVNNGHLVLQYKI